MLGVVLDHLIESDGCIAVDIDTSIEHLFVSCDEQPVISIGSAMNVAKDHVAPHDVRPGHHGVVAECVLPLPVRNIQQVVDAFKELFRLTTPDPSPVVISKDEMLLSPQPPQVFLRRFLIAVDQVAEDIDSIPPRDLAIPVFDEGFVHLLDTGKGPITKADTVFMAKMQVRGKEDHGVSPSFFCWGTGIGCHRQYFVSSS